MGRLKAAIIREYEDKVRDYQWMLDEENMCRTAHTFSLFPRFNFSSKNFLSYVENYLTAELSVTTKYLDKVQTLIPLKGNGNKNFYHLIWKRFKINV